MEQLLNILWNWHIMAKGVISDKSERHLQTIGIKEADHAQIAMREADLVIAIGYDLVEYSPRNWNRDLKKKIIHIDFTPAEVAFSYYSRNCSRYRIHYQCSSRRVSRGKREKGKENLNLGFPRHEIPSVFKKVKQEVVWRIERYKVDLSYPMKPEKLLYDIRNSLEEDDMIISDVGAHKLWIAKVYKTYSPNTCIITNGFCSMGFALPGAIAIKLARPNQKVVAMYGDGGFLMNVQELETATRLKLPVIVVIWCDSDLGMISLKQIDEFGRSAFTRFDNT
ncbi:MAG: thiamine pyrophosphate-dependent enzyme [Candidatus Nitrosopolaris sp.]